MALVENPPIGLLPVMNSLQVITEAAIPRVEEVQLALLDDPSALEQACHLCLAERFAEPIAAESSRRRYRGRRYRR